MFHRVSSDVIGRIGKAHPVPISKLVEFTRVHLPAGGAVSMTLALSAAKALTLVNEDGATVMYPGLHFLDVWDGSPANNVTIPIAWPGSAPAILRTPPRMEGAA